MRVVFCRCGPVVRIRPELSLMREASRCPVGALRGAPWGLGDRGGVLVEVELEQVGDPGGDAEFAFDRGQSTAGEASEPAAVFEVGVDGFHGRAATLVERCVGGFGESLGHPFDHRGRLGAAGGVGVLTGLRFGALLCMVAMSRSGPGAVMVSVEQ